LVKGTDLTILVASDQADCGDTSGADSPLLSSGLSNSTGIRRLLERKGVRQFVKFCIVGASSSVVNMVSSDILYHRFHLTYLASLSIGFLISVVNGFVWNRLWTFKEARGTSAQEQYSKFLAVNIVGFFLNTFLNVMFVAVWLKFHSHMNIDYSELVHSIIFKTDIQIERPVMYGCMLMAIALVSFWNFFANRRWTFKH
jgi:putative flippase GtrA